VHWSEEHWSNPARQEAGAAGACKGCARAEMQECGQQVCAKAGRPRPSATEVGRSQTFGDGKQCKKEDAPGTGE